VQPEGVGKLKKKIITSSDLEPATSRLAAWCLNQYGIAENRNPSVLVLSHYFYQFFHSSLIRSKRGEATQLMPSSSALVEALRYKPEVRGFEVIFFLIYVKLPAALGSGVHSASNRNEYRNHKKKSFWAVERGRCVRLITSPPSMSRRPKTTWDPQHLATL
jgi:hypothetical protein